MPSKGATVLLLFRYAIYGDCGFYHIIIITHHHHHAFFSLFTLILSPSLVQELTSTLSHSSLSLVNSRTHYLLLYFHLHMNWLHLRGRFQGIPFFLANSLEPERKLATKWVFFIFSLLFMLPLASFPFFHKKEGTNLWLLYSFINTALSKPTAFHETVPHRSDGNVNHKPARSWMIGEWKAAWDDINMPKHFSGNFWFNMTDFLPEYC